jgi:hypothetical protein
MLGGDRYLPLVRRPFVATDTCPAMSESSKREKSLDLTLSPWPLVLAEVIE